PILLDRSSDTAAELILPEFRLHSRQWIPRLRHVKHILRVEFVIAKKLKERSMKGVRSRFRDQVNDSATGPPGFRRVHVALDLDFLQSVNRRFDDNRGDGTFIIIHTVEQEIVRRIRLAIRRNGRGLTPVVGSSASSKRTLDRRGCPWRELHECNEVASVD